MKANPIVARLNIAITRNPWFSLGVHIDHTPPVYVALHLPGFMVWIGWLSVLGVYPDELVWSLRPVRTADAPN